MNLQKRLSAPAVLAAAFSAAMVGCGDDGDGTLTVTTFGEDFIEVAIPTAVGPDGEGFVDDTVVTYSKFLVNFTDLRVADRNGDVGATLGPVGVWDLTASGPHQMTELTIGAQTWEDVGITIQPNASAVAGNASAADVQDLVSNGASVRTVGMAVHEGTTYSFDWYFTTATQYRECVDGDGVAGVVVPDGGQVSMEITVHGDHLFFDDLQAEGSALRFEAFAAADGDEDGVLTLAELETVDLTELPTGQYGTGGDSSIVNLRQYVEAQTNSLIHFNGEGDCDQQRL